MAPKDKNINARPSEDGTELEIEGELDQDLLAEWAEMMAQTPEKKKEED